MKYSQHIRTVAEAWVVVDTVVNSLGAAVEDLERAQGVTDGPGLRTTTRLLGLRGRMLTYKLLHKRKDQRRKA